MKMSLSSIEFYPTFLIHLIITFSYFDTHWVIVCLSAHLVALARVDALAKVVALARVVALP